MFSREPHEGCGEFTAEALDVRKNPWQLTAVVYIGA
jgi:hypothetical protein